MDRLFVCVDVPSRINATTNSSEKKNKKYKKQWYSINIILGAIHHFITHVQIMLS